MFLIVFIGNLNELLTLNEQNVFLIVNKILF
jgi:hypothetical protein